MQGLTVPIMSPSAMLRKSLPNEMYGYGLGSSRTVDPYHEWFKLMLYRLKLVAPYF
jgi:hypothetical protein